MFSTGNDTRYFEMHYPVNSSAKTMHLKRTYFPLDLKDRVKSFCAFPVHSPQKAHKIRENEGKVSSAFFNSMGKGYRAKWYVVGYPHVQNFQLNLKTAISLVFNFFLRLQRTGIKQNK